MNDDRVFLRHTIATLAYRGGKATRGADTGFGPFLVSPSSRTPLQVLAHVGDLLDWGLRIAQGQASWTEAVPGSWDFEVQRFHRGLQALDAYLAGDAPLGASCEKLFQGPIADALTHVGQIAMLRRVAGDPIKGESFFRAEIEMGRVGADQAPAKTEFE